MKIQAISDTHGLHKYLKIEEGIDCLIHCGDSTNYYDLYRNEIEFNDFLNWFDKIDVKYKILIAGNHDAWSMKKYNLEALEQRGIIYLEHEYANIEGLKIFGSPYTPTFGNWYHMKDRSKLDRYWQVLEPDIDILITHGPPKGILDLSRDRNNNLEFCGDASLLRYIEKVKPKNVCFGHIHDYKDCLNYGKRSIDDNTIFYNCSLVEDGKFEQGLKHNGHIFEL